MNAVDSFSLFKVLLSGDFVIRFVLVSLFGLSIGVWTVFFYKISLFSSVKKKIKIFEKKFWSGVMLEDFYDKNKNKFVHPIGMIFSSAMEEWILSDVNGHYGSIDLIKEGVKERVFSATDVAMLNAEEYLSKYSFFMSSIVATAPFVGLFGTIWGIMNTFRAASASSVVSLNLIAPGVAESLITTAFGILVSIFAILISSFVDARMQIILDKLSSFRLELVSILSRELDNFSSKKDDEV